MLGLIYRNISVRHNQPACTIVELVFLFAYNVIVKDKFTVRYKATCLLAMEGVHSLPPPLAAPDLCL